MNKKNNDWCSFLILLLPLGISILFPIGVFIYFFAETVDLADHPVVLFFSFVVMVMIGITWKHHIFVRFVEKKSLKVREVQKLNEQQNFCKIYPEEKFIRENCDTKWKYDHFRLNDFVPYLIRHNYDFFEHVINQVYENRVYFDLYDQKFNHILSSNFDKNFKKNLLKENINIDDFREIEIEICKSLKMKPMQNFQLTIHTTYTSPAGRNHYEHDYHLNFDDLVAYLPPKSIRLDVETEIKSMKLEEEIKVSKEFENWLNQVFLRVGKKTLKNHIEKRKI